MKNHTVSRRGRRSDLILMIVISVTLAVIWIHSAMPGDVSSAESGFVYDVIEPVLRFLLPDAWVTEHLVRKMGHFCEYGVLGVEMLTLVALRGRVRLRFLVNTLLTGLLVAFIDETIQIFSGRGPMIADMWIDIAGFTLGGAVVLLIWKIKIPRGNQ